jgi:hypothetical protein
VFAEIVANGRRYLGTCGGLDFMTLLFLNASVEVIVTLPSTALRLLHPPAIETKATPNNRIARVRLMPIPFADRRLAVRCHGDRRAHSMSAVGSIN